MVAFDAPSKQPYFKLLQCNDLTKRGRHFTYRTSLVFIFGTSEGLSFLFVCHKILHNRYRCIVKFTIIYMYTCTFTRFKMRPYCTARQKKTHTDDQRFFYTEPKPLGLGGYRFLQQLFGSGLPTVNGHCWAQKRRLLTPAFTASMMTSYVDVSNKCVDVLVVSHIRRTEVAMRNLIYHDACNQCVMRQLTARDVT